MPREPPVTSPARCATAPPQGLGITVLRVRVTPARHVVGEPARGVEQGLTQAGVPLHEAGQPPAGQPGHILPDQDLRVAVRTGADADCRDPQRRRDPPPEIGGDPPEPPRGPARRPRGTRRPGTTNACPTPARLRPSA